MEGGGEETRVRCNVYRCYADDAEDPQSLRLARPVATRKVLRMSQLQYEQTSSPCLSREGYGNGRELERKYVYDV